MFLTEYFIVGLVSIWFLFKLFHWFSCYQRRMYDIL